MSTRDAARARWRADLHDFGAEALRSAGLHEMANENVIRAQANRDYADLMVRLDEAKRSGDRQLLREVKIEVMAFRSAERSFGPPRVGIINNFAEPSDDALTEMGY